MIHVVLSADSLSFPRPWNQKLLDDRPDQFFRVEHTYPFLLRERLGAVFNTDVIVSNLGRRACTIAHLTAVARDLCSWMSPDFVIVHHGIVDCWIRDPVTLERRTSEAVFEKALDDFFELRQTLAPQLPTVFLGILPTNKKMLKQFPKQNEFIHAYNEIVRKKILNYTECNVHFIALDEDLNDLFQLVHEDGHHLSRLGRERAANAIADVIIEHLADTHQSGLQDQNVTI
jgi:lysophospholipase L1-like esterase